MNLINEKCPKKDNESYLNNHKKFIKHIYPMNNLINNSDEKVLVKASDLLKKFKTKEDRYNFLREMSKPFFIILDLYFPNEIGFDSNYFLQVLIGAKKVNNILFNS